MLLILQIDLEPCQLGQLLVAGHSCARSTVATLAARCRIVGAVRRLLVERGAGGGAAGAGAFDALVVGGLQGVAGVVEVEQSVVPLFDFFLELGKLVEVADERLLHLVHKRAQVVCPFVVNRVGLRVELALLRPGDFVRLAQTVVKILARLLRLL